MSHFFLFLFEGISILRFSPNICCINVAIFQKIVILLLRFVFHIIFQQNPLKQTIWLLRIPQIGRAVSISEKKAINLKIFLPPPWRIFLGGRQPAGGGTEVYRFLLSIYVVPHVDYWGDRNFLNGSLLSLKVRKNAKNATFYPPP